METQTPSAPKAIPNVQFKIVQEYTLDDTSTSNLCASTHKQQEHVETTNPPEPRPVITEGTNKQDTSMPNEPAESVSSLVENTPLSKDQPNSSSGMETPTQPMPTTKVSQKRSIPALEYGGTSSTDDHLEHVETASAALQLSSYPWEKRLSIDVNRLHELDIDIWCNKISDYYRYRTVKRTSSGKVKYGKTKSDPTPDQLIARANSLINQSKEWIDLAVNVKEEAMDKGVALCEVTGTKLHVETDDKKKALSSLHAVTIAKLSPPSNVAVPVGTVDNKISPPTSSSTNKKNRTVGCKMCEQSFPSVRDLNTHHRADHGIVKCHHCSRAFGSRAFGTRTALDKHMYNHQELDFLCIICGKRFTFQSRLDQHKLVHQLESALECKEPECGKKFKGIGDYNCHLKTHQDGGWYPCDFCTYKNKDKRNTMSHMRTHTKESEGRYECDKCF